MKCKDCKFYLSDNQCPIPSYMLREGNGCRMGEEKEEFGE